MRQLRKARWFRTWGSITPPYCSVTSVCSPSTDVITQTLVALLRGTAKCVQEMNNNSIFLLKYQIVGRHVQGAPDVAVAYRSLIRKARQCPRLNTHWRASVQKSHWLSGSDARARDKGPFQHSGAPW